MTSSLFQMVSQERKSHVVYSALLKALDHPAVQPVIERVSQRRLGYLVASFRLAGLGAADARYRARYLRRQRRLPAAQPALHQARMPQEEFEAYVEHLTRTLVPA